MRNITISLVALFGLLPAYAAGPKINAATNVDWTKVSGTGAPSATCNSSIYGEPYTNSATGDFYVCAVSGWVLFPGAGGTIGGSATSGFLAIGTGAASIGPSLADYGISVAGTFTFPKPTIFNDGTGVAGTAALQQGTATSNSTTSVTLTVPTSVTSYRIVLPGVHSTGSNTFLSCTAADPSVCTWAAGGGGGGGGYTNVTGSVAETTVALINTACGSGTYYATTALSIATGGTITCPVQFSKAGLWTIASGQTVTFSKLITETDAPSQLFTGSGSVVLAAGQQTPVEWFGAVAVATGSSCGTDYATQLQKSIDSLSTGNIVLGVGNYCKSTALTISHSSQGIVGVAPGSKDYGYGTSNPSSPSRIVTTAAGVDGIDIAGSSSQFLYSNVLNNFAHARSLSPTGTATGISLSYMAGLQMQGVSSSDSVRNFYVKAMPGYPTGNISYNAANWGQSGVTDSGTLYGWYFDGSATSFYSVILKNNAAVNTGGQGTTSYGFYFSGTSNTDVNGDGNGTAGVNYGVYVTGGAQDFFWNNSTADGITTSCIYLTGGAVSASFDGGWCNGTAASTYGIDIESSTGVIVTGMQISSGGRTAGIRVNAGRDVTVTHNLVGLGSLSSVTGIQVNATTDSVISNNNIEVFNSSTGISVSGGSLGNTISDNSIRGNATVTGIAVTGSTNNAIGGNSIAFSGATTVGISYDASSTNNPYAQINAFYNAATSISDAGTGNQLTGAGTVTSIATTSPIGGGTITGTGTLTCTTCVVASSPGAGVAHFAGSTQTVTSTTVALSEMATQAADSVVMNKTGSTAAPTAAVMPTCTTGNADLYDTTSHTWSCVSTGAGGGNFVNLCALVTLTNATCTSGLITGGTTPSSITISAIPGTYLNLEIEISTSLSGAGVGAILITFNSDTTSGHYLWARTGGLTAGSNTTAGATSSGTVNMQSCLIGGTNEPAGSCHIIIPMYAQGRRKTFQALNWWGDAAGGGGGGSATGEWNQTTAITSVTFTPASGTFTTGALLTIHGIN